MTSAKTTDGVQISISKASYLPEDIIVMIVDELERMETLNMHDSLLLNKHWYLCVASCKFKSLKVATKINQVSVSPYALKTNLKDGDDLTIDLTKNKLIDDSWDIEDVIHRKARSSRISRNEARKLITEIYERSNIIPSPKFHQYDKILRNMTIVLRVFGETYKPFTYDTEKTKCLNLNLMNISKMVCLISIRTLSMSRCSSVHTRNILVKFDPFSAYISVKTIKTFHMDFSKTFDIHEIYYHVEKWLNNLMTILPNLKELRITNLTMGEGYDLNKGGLPESLFLDNSNFFEVYEPHSANTKVLSMRGEDSFAQLSGMPLKYLSTNHFDWTRDCECKRDDVELPHTQECTLPLQVLDISDSIRNEFDLEEFYEAWPNLKALNCSNTSVFGKELKYFIAERRDSLEEVVALNCSLVSEEVDEWIAENVRKTQTDTTGRRGYEGKDDYTLFDVATFLENC